MLHGDRNECKLQLDRRTEAINAEVCFLILFLFITVNLIIHRHIHTGGNLQQPIVAREVKLQSIGLAGDPQGSVYSFISGGAEKLYSGLVDCEAPV